jgi:hypothetical protein
MPSKAAKLETALVAARRGGRSVACSSDAFGQTKYSTATMLGQVI